MKDAIKFNKNIHKLSQNEKKFYYELQKYISKDKSLDILIGSYLSGNDNKKLVNRINKILYDKYKNNLITQKEYTNMLNQINKTQKYIMTESILNSNEHKINNNTLTFNFRKPIRFTNSHISLTNMIFYNYFPNIDENYKIYVNYNNETTIINFSKGAYNINDINDIINLELNEKYDFKIDKINIIIDVNQYSILIILEKGFTLILDENFKKLFGFSNGIINESYTRSDLVPEIDRVKYLEIYSNIVNNANDDQFLSNIFINGDVSNLITFNESNIYKKQKIYGNTFDFLEITIKDQNNRDIELKDFFQISAYIS